MLTKPHRMVSLTAAKDKAISQGPAMVEFDHDLELPHGALSSTCGGL
jgi:hypothetical protein